MRDCVNKMAPLIEARPSVKSAVIIASRVYCIARNVLTAHDTDAFENAAVFERSLANRSITLTVLVTSAWDKPMAVGVADGLSLSDAIEPENPRRVSLPRKRFRPLASRLLTVPTGQPRWRGRLARLTL